MKRIISLLAFLICIWLTSCASLILDTVDTMCSFADDKISGCTQYLEKYPNDFDGNRASAYAVLANAYENKKDYKSSAINYRAAYSIQSAVFARGGHSSYATEAAKNLSGEFRALCELNGGSYSDCDDLAENNSQLKVQVVSLNAAAIASEERSAERSAEVQRNVGIIGGALLGAAATAHTAKQPGKTGANPQTITQSGSTYPAVSAQTAINDGSPNVNECMVLETRQEPGYGKRKLTNTCDFTVELKWCEGKAGAQCYSFDNQLTIQAGKSATIWEGAGRVEWGACRGANSIHSSANSGLKFRCD